MISQAHIVVVYYFDGDRASRHQGADVHGGDSIACSPSARLVPKAWILNQALGLRTLAKRRRRHVLRGYGSLGRQGSHAQGEEGDEGLHGHTHKRGECVRALSSSFALPNPCLSIMRLNWKNWSLFGCQGWWRSEPCSKGIGLG